MEFAEKAIDLISAVKGLHSLGSQELSRLLKQSDRIPLSHSSENGSFLEIDIEKLARFLPLHLIAVTLSSKRDETLLRYLLCGLRLLHSLCEIASRHPKLEQILLDDVRVSEQLLDLVFYLIIISTSYREEHHVAHPIPLLHSTLVACSMHLLTVCISTQWHELAYVLLAHPKVDLFVDVVFKAVCRSFNFLQIRLSAEQNKFCSKSNSVAGQTLTYLCQQCEASLQFLQFLCQQKSFREHLLRHKELCVRGGILLVAQVAMKLKVSLLSREPPAVVAAVSRIKSRVLSILLHLCEADNISFLDEVANDSHSLDLAKFVALEVLELLKTMLTRGQNGLGSPGGKTYPTGFLQLNALRLVDIFSDDSNFRSYITAYVTELVEPIFSLPYQEFLSTWCSSEHPLKEEDATLEYEPFKAAGWVIDSCSSLELMSAENLDSTILRTNLTQASYAHQRTSLLVKVIANLHCFVPKICAEQERNLFLLKFVESLQIGLPKSSTHLLKAATVCKNFGSLLGHAESLVPTFLNEEDVQLLRVFFTQLQSEVCPAGLEANKGQAYEAQSKRACGSFQPGDIDPNHKGRNGTLKEGVSENSDFQEMGNSCFREDVTDEVDTVTTHDQRIHRDKSAEGASACVEEEAKDAVNGETSGSDSSSARGNHSSDHPVRGENCKSSNLARRGFGGALGDEKFEIAHSEERRPRKRKRTIMNDKQVSIMEMALLEEPDMQKNAVSVQSWAEKLSLHGAEVASSQLRNWLNNRKARLARAAAKDSGRLWENSLSGKQDGHEEAPSSDTPESPTGNSRVPSAADGETRYTEVAEELLRTNVERRAGSPHADFSSRPNIETDCSTSNCKWEPGQIVVLLDDHGMEIAKAKVNQVKGKWNGITLEESNSCVVDIIEFKAESDMGKPYLPQATDPMSKELEMNVGKMKVLWDYSKMLMLQHH